MAPTPEFLSLMALIAALSVVQSMFGMGILVFGTPTLLLAGYDFITAIGYLLPASFAVSLLQVLTGGRHRTAISRHLYVLCLPAIGAGLLAVRFTPVSDWLNLFVGGTLLATVWIRLRPAAQAWLKDVLEHRLGLFHLVMGLVHGLTNLGGGLLVVLAGTVATDKRAIRYTVAHYYLLFSIIQMTMLAVFMGQGAVLLANAALAGVSATIHLAVGNGIFARAPNPIYNNALTAFIAAYGIVVLLAL